jgi:hypothetical protein
LWYSYEFSFSSVKKQSVKPSGGGEYTGSIEFPAFHPVMGITKVLNIYITTVKVTTAINGMPFRVVMLRRISAVVISKIHPRAVRGKVTVAIRPWRCVTGTLSECHDTEFPRLAQDANQDQYDQNDNDGI